MRTSSLVFIVAFGILGCATTNPVHDYYTDYTSELAPETLEVMLEPSASNPKVRITSDFATDVKQLLQDGYVLIGGAAFSWSNSPSEEKLSAKALEVGADVVVFNSTYSHMETGVKPIVGVTPGSTSTTTSSGYASVHGTANYTASAYGSGGYVYGSGSATASAYGSYSGYSTTTTDPQFYTYYVPYQQQVNSYQIGFFRKSKPPVFGVYALALDDETRQQIQRNTGALVSLVVNSSPAFSSNILEGDIITRIGDYAVELPDDIQHLANRYAASTAAVELIRDGKILSCDVSFGNSPTPSLEQIRSFAEKGNVEAQFSLANRYLHGDGVPQDHQEALRWYQKAADREYAPAQAGIGFMYAQGQGIPKNPAEARKWFNRAAEQQYLPGINGLAMLHYRGEGIPKDYKSALQLFQQASDQGDPDAITMLGVIYSSSESELQDKVEALKWFTLAAGMGHDIADQERVAISSGMTAEQIKEAERLAEDWRAQRTKRVVSP